MRLYNVLFCGLLLSQSLFVDASQSFAPSLSKPALDQQINTILKEFNSPGMSIGVVHQGQVIHLEGYGVLDIVSKRPVTASSLFRLASTSKAFTSMSLAMLVDQGLINWHDKVIDHIPEFQLADPWVTRQFRIIDLLTHNSGLMSGAGDEMLWPEPTGFSREEIISKLKYLEPSYGYRSQFGYSNVFYIVAGQVVEKVTGVNWEQYVQDNILKPLDMRCFAGDIAPEFLTNVATPYGDVDGKYFAIQEMVFW